MSKNSIDAYGALGKSNVLFFDPEVGGIVRETLAWVLGQS